MNQINRIQQQIEPLRQQIINHPLYASIQNIEDLKIFMQHHVYAVWDFMSLLKSLQRKLTCVSIPWFAIGNADTRFLINEIVVGEESDVDSFGIRKSHFEIYIDAMTQSGAPTNQIDTFLNELKITNNFETAYFKAQTSPKIQNFINFIFDIINSNKKYLQAAVFTFGREDLIPNMFVSIVNDIYKNFPNEISIFKYYLERHIEVDGDHHSHLALQMTENLCGTNELYWQEATETVKKALEQRLQLWDAAYEAIVATREVSAKV